MSIKLSHHVFYTDETRFTRHTFNLMQASCRVSLDDLCMDNDSVAVNHTLIMYSLDRFRTIVPTLNTMVALC